MRILPRTWNVEFALVDEMEKSRMQKNHMKSVL